MVLDFGGRIVAHEGVFQLAVVEIRLTALNFQSWNLLKGRRTLNNGRAFGYCHASLWYLLYVRVFGGSDILVDLTASLLTRDM